MLDAGSRLRVEVTSASFPRFEPNRNVGVVNDDGRAWTVARQTVFHDRLHPSRVVLSTVTAR
jgi:predicted acyl esterase